MGILHAQNPDLRKLAWLDRLFVVEAGNIDPHPATQDDTRHFTFNFPVQALVLYRANPFVSCIEVVAKV